MFITYVDKAQMWGREKGLKLAVHDSRSNLQQWGGGILTGHQPDQQEHIRDSYSEWNTMRCYLVDEIKTQANYEKLEESSWQTKNNMSVDSRITLQWMLVCSLAGD